MKRRGEKDFLFVGNSAEVYFYSKVIELKHFWGIKLKDTARCLKVNAFSIKIIISDVSTF
jgi:hypothetical protein